jgi:hypothetical protein
MPEVLTSDVLAAISCSPESFPSHKVHNSSFCVRANEESASYDLGAISVRSEFLPGGCMQNVLRTVAFGAALAVAATAVPSFAAITYLGAQDHDRDHDQVQEHPDYSNNSYYRLGNREGYQDYRKKTQRKEHNHKYRNDTDHQAHDYGYQQGLQGQRGYNNDSHDDRHNDSDPHH